MRLTPFIAAALCAAAALAYPAAPAVGAGKTTYEDRQRGYRVRIGDKFEQVPPKLTADKSYVVGNWYADAAKYDRSFGRPEFRILWFATPKSGTVTPKEGEPAPPPAAPETPQQMFERMQAERRAKSVDEALDEVLQSAAPLFGGEVPKAADLWKDAATVATKTPHLDARWAEVNDPDDRKKREKKDKDDDKDKDKNGRRGRTYSAYAFVAKLVIDRPGESIEVGFLGTCGEDFVKAGKEEFLAVVKSFEDLTKVASDSRNLAAQRELDENDPEAFRAAIKKDKLIKGWVAVDTPHYVVVYPKDDVDPGLAKNIAVQIEALRTQVYESVFPPDRPIKAISVVRCCKDREQYSAYGGPGGSAGYWYAPGKELVFYEDRSKKDDSLRVLYHEGFHQYIYYSVGDFSPHSWFNEGNGDFFFGFNFENGKWVRAINTWRRDHAARAKREHKFPPLWEWLHWSQPQYYGGNDRNVPIGDNYALGWDFVWFLRTTKKKEYQGILDRYFNTLKGSVTKARAATERLRGGGVPEGPPAGGSPGDGAPAPAAEDLQTLLDPDKWLDNALDEAFKGVDMQKLEADWLEE